MYQGAPPFPKPQLFARPSKTFNFPPAVPKMAYSTVAISQMYPLLGTHLFLQTTLTPFVKPEGALLEQVQCAKSEMFEDIASNKIKWADDNPVVELKDKDPVADYLLLPEEYFSDPKKNTILDPNYFIDAFCSIEQQPYDLIWLLDIELGMPYSKKRPIATYDVQLCKIVRKNCPGVEHPGFAKCDKHFQQLLLYYYDSVVSSWYLGYISYYGDTSVVNFQNWLSPIMNCIGLCWR